MVNSSLKKLKFHLASFDMVVKERTKERTTATAITEGMWGFEHTKAYFKDEIIPFVKALKELFNSFDQFLIDELTEVQNVFNQMERAFEQHCVEKNKFQDKMKDILKENERPLEQAISTDIVNIVVNANVNYACKTANECERYVIIETELQKDFIKKECYDKLFEQYTTLKKHCISLEVDTQLKQEIFQRNSSFSQQSAPTFDQFFKINDLKAQSQEKDTIIMKLKKRIKSHSGNVKVEKIKREIEEIETINIELDHRVTKLVAETLKDTLSKLKGKAVVNEAVTLHPIDTELLKIDVAPLAPKLRNNRTTHYDYLKHTQEETTTLREIVENKRLLNPLNTSLDYALGNACPLTRNTTNAKEPLRKPIVLESNPSKPKVGISHETSVARSPQQNGVVERRNQAVATTCYTQNRSIVRLRHGKTPYDLLHGKLPDLSLLHVFGALCYLTNDSENLGKLQPKADIGVFIGYAPTKKAFWIYNHRTKRIIETIHVNFDELTAKQFRTRTS
nr:retrovirus-related Pol polyprotein from transposon TNT 1-94 [Tanacetum cinerariifolium]